MFNNNNLNKRQEAIVKIVGDSDVPMAISELIKQLDRFGEKTTRITIIRDLSLLIQKKYFVRQGKGRNVAYLISPFYRLIKPIAVAEYFKIDPDQRSVIKSFNFDIFSLLKNIFTDEEVVNFKELNKIYQNNIKRLTPIGIKKEYERLTIELSWKSSKIEGNTYSLLETERLLRDKVESSGHTHEEAIMILNHKAALDYIRGHVNQFKKISISKIEDFHYLLIKGLGVERNLRKRVVRIAGTTYAPLDNQFQIREAMEKFCHLVNTQKNPFVQALTALLLIAYIQPFEDGNKRTSRLLANAILLANSSCPLSFRSIDEIEYKKAMLLFYEQNSLAYLKELFIQQFEFAVKNYF
ncbi:MAG: hypothetical protein A2538_03100 [Candidatus Magasanikbacteria bacterium RIFOXYD2_FULL_41_14]|uniref:Fido domain-containing protein n=1 Tax=Candidatus Magasanikbacteria bacterium RIFOXYD2_FULL_41_14 TaxID=1798709 RepID=A0A1F6PD69_9BACT|nr:MAG: hypothetical protein A2538_03100 [Candidatus Magasanikbacteria bacterium RIFOXYD2_FULL_41_14]